jgi:hypothetical protein
VHEYRHVQQYSNFNKGLSKFAGVFVVSKGKPSSTLWPYLTGFLEGDAVHSETALQRRVAAVHPISSMATGPFGATREPIAG